MKQKDDDNNILALDFMKYTPPPLVVVILVLIHLKNQVSIKGVEIYIYIITTQ